MERFMLTRLLYFELSEISTISNERITIPPEIVKKISYLERKSNIRLRKKKKWIKHREREKYRMCLVCTIPETFENINNFVETVSLFNYVERRVQFSFSIRSPAFRKISTSLGNIEKPEHSYIIYLSIGSFDNFMRILI